MLIENYVPHGFGVAQVSVFGTGESNHCMDLMGTDEQRSIDAAVTWLGTQPWSNGKVGMIGKSYDGSTPWQAATFGNPHLATIVPMSGLIGVHELMWRNGSMEARGAVMHNGVYGSFGIDGDSEDAHTLCEGYLEGYVNGPAAYMTGGMVKYAGNDYWTERSFLDRVVQNYNGSVYIIQGMQDWNADPHMSFPTHQIVEDAGIEIKTLAGQWAHDYPDRKSDTVHFPAERAPKPTPTPFVGTGPMKCCTGLTGTSKAKVGHPRWGLRCKTTEAAGGLKRPTPPRTRSIERPAPLSSTLPVPR